MKVKAFTVTVKVFAEIIHVDENFSLRLEQF